MHEVTAMSKVTAMNNNEQDHISQDDKRSSGVSYVLLVLGALFATPIATYLEPNLNHNIIFSNLGPACGLILLAKSYLDKDLNRSQRLQYWIVLGLSIFISYVTFMLQVGTATLSLLR